MDNLHIQAKSNRVIFIFSIAHPLPGLSKSVLLPSSALFSILLYNVNFSQSAQP